MNGADVLLGLGSVLGTVRPSVGGFSATVIGIDRRIESEAFKDRVQAITHIQNKHGIKEVDI